MHNSTGSNGLSDAFDLKYLSSDLKIISQKIEKKKVYSLTNEANICPSIVTRSY